MHNLFVPHFHNGVPMNQYCGNGFASKRLCAEFDGKTFVWETDNSELWVNALVKKSIRKIISESPDRFIVYDTMEFYTPMQCSFRLNMYDVFKDRVRIVPVNWKPVHEWYGELGADY